MVCHQAAVVGAGVNAADAPSYGSHNDFGTAVLLAEMFAAGCRRLVLASSMVVYGQGRYDCAEHGPVDPLPRTRADLDAGVFEHRCPLCGATVSWRLVDEDAPLRPRSLYAASKTAQEHYALAWAEAVGGSVIALRYHNVYGPNMPRDTPYSGVAAIFRSELESGDVPRVFEDGGQMRDFVHVDDIAAANVAAVESALRRIRRVQRLLGPADLDHGGGDRAVRGPRRRGARRHRAVPQRRCPPHRRRPRRAPPSCWAFAPPSTRATVCASSRSHRCGHRCVALAVVVAIVALVASGLLALVWSQQRRLIYFPSPGPVPPAAAVLPNGQDVVLETDDGIRLGAWYFPVAGGPAVLVCNGNGGDRSVRAELAAALNRMGLSVLLFDYRGYGGNPGRPSEDGLAADARAAQAWLARQPGVEKIVYFGESLGAAVAVGLAVERPPAALDVAVAVHVAARRGRGALSVAAGAAAADWTGIRRSSASASVHVPVMVIAGDRDDIVPEALSRRLYDAANEPKRYRLGARRGPQRPRAAGRPPDARRDRRVPVGDRCHLVILVG